MGPPRPGPISWRSIMEWSRAHRLGGEDARLLDLCCQAMDGAWIEHNAREQERMAQLAKGRK
jgi:hypothetical protein